MFLVFEPESVVADELNLEVTDSGLVEVIAREPFFQGFFGEFLDAF